MNIAGVEVGPDQPCRVVAEISNNHNGKLENAIRLIDGAAAAGADFVKFQAYTPDELVRLRGDGPAPEPWGSEGWSMRDLYEKAQTPHEWFPEMVAECESVGVPWFSSVFGGLSLGLLKRLGCPAYKIAALDVDTEFALFAQSDWGNEGRPPIIASSRNGRIPWADLTLYCPPGYPQEWESLLVDATVAGVHLTDGTDGVSYHGTDVNAAKMLTTGQQMLEVHVQLDDVPSELEANVSLTVSDLRMLCEAT